MIDVEIYAIFDPLIIHLIDIFWLRFCLVAPIQSAISTFVVDIDKERELVSSYGIACSIRCCQISIHYVINGLNNVRKNINNPAADYNRPHSVLVNRTIYCSLTANPNNEANKVHLSVVASITRCRLTPHFNKLMTWRFYCKNMLFSSMSKSSSSSSCCCFRAIKGFVVVGGLFFFARKQIRFQVIRKV